MTFASVDIETYKEQESGWFEPVLDPTEFKIGCYNEERMEPRLFYDKKKMWEYIIERGRVLKERGNMLEVYGHNHIFDYEGYADLESPNVIWFSENPFILSYYENGREIVKFLDTLKIFRMSLKELGKIIGIEKMEMPERVRSVKELEEYVVNDTKIVLASLGMLQKKLADDGIQMKRFVTISQIAINYILNLWRREKYPFIFEDETRNMIWKQHSVKLIHDAVRGARNIAYRTGEVKDVTRIDRNSLYGFSAKTMRFPDLRTQKMVKSPLEAIKAKEILSKIGISTCLLKNNVDDYGLICVREETGNYFPKSGSYILGTWTNKEILTAINDGLYTLMDIEKTLFWDDAPVNPYYDMVDTLYDKRKGNAFDNQFYKSVINMHIGKFAQHRVSEPMKVDEISKAEEYLRNGWTIPRSIGNKYLYKDERPKKWLQKPYYCPLLTALVYAEARVDMWHELRKIPISDLLYTDTDDVTFTGNHIKKFKLGNGLGEYKVLHKHEEGVIWGQKMFRIGNDIKASGIPKSSLTRENFETGHIEVTKRDPIAKQHEDGSVGAYRKHDIVIKEVTEKHKRIQELLGKKVLFIDKEMEDISYFLPMLNGLEIGQ